MKKLKAMMAGVLLTVGCSAAPAFALTVDSETGLLQPGAALVAPFDQTRDRATFLVASNHGPGTVVTHWTFWGDNCAHLVDVGICLTANGTVVVDPTKLISIGGGGQQIGTNETDLSGFRGLVTVHAIQPADDCRLPAQENIVLVDDTLLGSFSIANTKSNAAFGGNAFVLGLFDGAAALPSGELEALDVPTFNPEDLEASEAIAIGLRRRAGDLPGEVGPLGSAPSQLVHAQARFFDNQEVGTSLPDVGMGCALFASVKDLPQPTVVNSSGFFHFDSITPRVGFGRTWVYAIHGMAVGPFGTMAYATYSVSEPEPTATPEPTGTPVPTSVPEPSATPAPTEPEGPTASPEPTPEASAVLGMIQLPREGANQAGKCPRCGLDAHTLAQCEWVNCETVTN